LTGSISNYHEGYASLELDAGFFRPDSVLARDFSVLFAAMQFHENKGGGAVRWLDLMSGSGIRALRWGLEAAVSKADQRSVLRNLEIWANDADFDRCNLIQRNLQPLLHKGISLRFTNDFAEVLLARSFLDKHFFNFVDFDCFGSPNSLLQPVIRVLGFDGILVLSSTDGRSTTGHDRLAGVRSLSASTRTHPASWEMAIRLQLAAVARQAWLLGRGLEPLACFSDGRTFRLFIRLKRNLFHKEESQLGFIARCETCGSQTAQTLLNIKDWEECFCGKGLGHWSINGPLWLGPLQSPNILTKIKEINKELSLPIVDRSLKLLDRLEADSGVPVFSWSTHELASRVPMEEPPSLDLMIKLLRLEGYQAFRNGVVPGHFRTNASIGELLRICEEKLGKGFK